MPICPRCGKCLSSEQALTYHLNRKYKCGTWNCVNCKTHFNTKFQLQMHEMECLGDRSSATLPNTDMLLDVYHALPFVCVHLNSDTLRADVVSPQAATVLQTPVKTLQGMTKKEMIQWIQTHCPDVTHHDVHDRLFFLVKHN